MFGIIDDFRNFFEKRKEIKRFNEEEKQYDALGYPKRHTKEEVALLMQNHILLDMQTKHFAFQHLNVEYDILDDFTLNIFDTRTGMEELKGSPSVVLGSYSCDETNLRMIMQLCMDFESFKDLSLNELETTTHIGIQKSHRFLISRNHVSLLVHMGLCMYNFTLSRDKSDVLDKDTQELFKKQLLKLEKSFQPAEFVTMDEYDSICVAAKCFFYLDCFTGKYRDCIINFLHAYGTDTISKSILKSLLSTFRSAATNPETENVKLRSNYLPEIKEARDILAKYNK